MHATKGNRPLCACGTRFIAHNAAAINCLLDKYGAYIAHLCTFIEDSSVKQADKPVMFYNGKPEWSSWGVLSFMTHVLF